MGAVIAYRTPLVKQKLDYHHLTDIYNFKYWGCSKSVNGDVYVYMTDKITVMFEEDRVYIMLTGGYDAIVRSSTYTIGDFRKLLDGLQVGELNPYVPVTLGVKARCYFAHIEEDSIIDCEVRLKRHWCKNCGKKFRVW